MFKERTKGILFWKRKWISICSAHREYDNTCNCCQAGAWHSSIKLYLESVLYDISPKLWQWWVNR